MSAGSNDSSNSQRNSNCNGFGPQKTMSGQNLEEAMNYTSTDPNKAVLLRLDVRGNSTEFLEPITVPARFQQIAQEYPDAIAFKYQNYNLLGTPTYEKCEPINLPWETVTYKQYLQNVRETAKAFLALGLEPKSSVGIMGFNSPQWAYCNLGAIFAGGLSTGVYTTNNHETCHHVLHDSSANVVVVEDSTQLNKILKIQERLPRLKAIVQYKTAIAPKDKELANSRNFPLYTWDEFIGLARNIPDSKLDQITFSLKANMCCCLIYTSGTTGNPKGVMISHDNITWTARQTAKMIKIRTGRETLLSYLPLSHIAAQIVDMYVVMDTANTIYFAHSDVLKGTLVQYLKFVRPTIFIGVPRVWEKIVEKMQSIGKTSKGAKKKIATWAKGIGSQGCDAIMRGKSPPWSWGLANAIVFKKIRVALGLDRCTYMVSTGAPLAKETRCYLESLNLPVMEVFGMSECTGPSTINYKGVGNYWAGSAGLALIGTQVRIGTSDDDNSGELCMRGRHVFMGYIHRDAETLDTIDRNGWLRTGDLGKLEMTETGGHFVYITGRIKELIITAGGENVAPVPIEDAIKEELNEFISNAMVVGDYKKYLSILLTVKTEPDASGLPTDKLTTGAHSWLTNLLGHENDSNSDHHNTAAVPNTVSKLLQKDKNLPASSVLHNAIESAIKKVNERGISRAANIRKWRILLRDFSLPGGELGPTMKLRRPIVHKMYAELIESIYNEDTEEGAEPSSRITKPEQNGKAQGGEKPLATHPPNSYLSPKVGGHPVPGTLVDSTLSLKHSESYITHI